jgi:putative transposase
LPNSKSFVSIFGPYDRDTKFSTAFREILKSADVEPVILPPRSPNLNAHIERFMRSLKDECLNRMIFFGEYMLRNAVREYIAHYHTERNHQGLANKLIDPDPDVGKVPGTIECRERLGGLLRYYHRKAAA